MAPWSSTFSQSQTAEPPGSTGPSRPFVLALGFSWWVRARRGGLTSLVLQNAPSYAGQFKRTITAGGDKKAPFAELATLHVWTLVALNVRHSCCCPEEDRQNRVSLTDLNVDMQPVMNPMTHQMYPVDAVVAYEKQHELVTSVRSIRSA
jgi:hypothetical protein